MLIEPDNHHLGDRDDVDEYDDDDGKDYGDIGVGYDGDNSECVSDDCYLFLI